MCTLFHQIMLFLTPVLAMMHRCADEEEEEGGLPLNRKLTRLVLTPGSATPGARGGPHSPIPYDSNGRRR